MKSEYEVETGKANGYFALSSSGKKRGLTAVTRNGKICSKFTFIFRKNFYLSRKYAVPKFATSCSGETLVVIVKKNRGNET